MCNLYSCTKPQDAARALKTGRWVLLQFENMTGGEGSYKDGWLSPDDLRDRLKPLAINCRKKAKRGNGFSRDQDLENMGGRAFVG